MRIEELLCHLAGMRTEESFCHLAGMRIEESFYAPCCAMFIYKDLWDPTGYVKKPLGGTRMKSVMKNVRRALLVGESFVCTRLYSRIKKSMPNE